MDLGLTGRTAIVCGASAGIGLALRRVARGEGANVVMFARRRRRAEREAARLGALAVPATSRARPISSGWSDRGRRHGGIDVLV